MPLTNTLIFLSSSPCADYTMEYQMNLKNYVQQRKHKQINKSSYNNKKKLIKMSNRNSADAC